jgi:DNA/RNA endonuclease YhcR with UshA esterase domain
MAGRTSTRLVKLAVVALATIGLVSLWYVAVRTEIPTVAIGRIDGAMNLAYVRLVGRCSRSLSYDPRTGTLSFWIADDTGEVRVVSYGAETRALIEQQRVPAFGDEIAVAGTLRVAEDVGTLTIDIPDELAISRADPLERPIGAIGMEDQYQRVLVRGQVRDVREPYQELTLITLRDLTGAIDVVVSKDLVALSGVTPTVAVGESVEVVAAVSRYGDTPQLVPASTVDIVRLDTGVPVASERPIMELTRQGVGRWFAVSGTVTRMDPFSSGVRLTLDDGSGAITVLFWRDIYDALHGDLADDPGPGLGAKLRIQGRLSEYRDELELVPGLPTDVGVLTAPATPRTTRTTSIGALTADDVGRRVTLQGTLGRPESFSAGVKALLSDDSGAIVLLLWEEVYDALPAAGKLVPGVQIEVTGEIDEYRGDLEIVPEVDGVRVVE